MTQVQTQAVGLADESRDIKSSLWRGFRGHCPQCAKGGLFRAYLKVEDRCAACNLDLTPQRSDDAPPYITMMIVGHLLILGVALVEDAFAPPIWVHLSIWLPLATLLSLWLLPRVKGAIVGLQWALGMGGFARA